MNKEIYNRAFFYLVAKTNIDYAVNLEYEFGVDEVIREAYEAGFDG